MSMQLTFAVHGVQTQVTLAAELLCKSTLCDAASTHGTKPAFNRCIQVQDLPHRQKRSSWT